MIMVVLFGLAALRLIPVQLNPTIDRPVISVYTDYPGAAAMEVESEVTLRQEQKLATVQNLRRIHSESEEGQVEIHLEFEWGVDKDAAVIDINTKLGSVRDLPDETEKPVIYASDSEEYTSVVRMTVLSDLPVNQIREIMEETIGPRLERIEGVGRVRWYGGSRRQIQVLVDLTALDSRQITINEVREALRNENQNRRGGDIEDGASRVLVRTVGQFTDLDQIRRTVIKNGPDGVVRIEDIADVVDGFEEPESVGGTMGKPAVSVSIAKVTGSNTIGVTNRIKAEAERINAEFDESGLELWINYDASIYIWDAILRVTRNLLIGAVSATIVLFLFLRSISSTLTIAVTIPLCLIGTFVLLAAFGRSLNVISLAGLAFAAGMVVDNAVVVMENIFRHSKMSKHSPSKAAVIATKEVWAPIVAASLTTLVVFIPVLFIKEQAGQLFRDIAFSISFAVILSMVTSITVIPMLASRLLKAQSNDPNTQPDGAATSRSKSGRRLDRLGDRVCGWFIRTVSFGLRSVPRRIGIFSVVTIAFFCGLKLIPSAEYLPQSKSANVFGRISNPTGMSLEGAQMQLKKVENYVLNHVDHLYRMFSYARHSSSFFGFYLESEHATAENADIAMEKLETFAKTYLPSDFRFSVYRVSDFGWRFEGKSIELEIVGPDLEVLRMMSEDLEAKLRSISDVKEVFSSFTLANPELQVVPDRERLADLGLTSTDLALAVETMVEGTRASYYREGGREHEILLKAREGQIVHADAIRDLLVAVPSGYPVRLSEVADVRKQLGPVKVEHVNKERSISLRINIHDGVPLQSFIEKTKEEVLKPFQQSMAEKYRVSGTAYQSHLAGTADDLERTMDALAQSFLFAILISYLLMAALFQSFAFPLIILFSLPLALTGGFVGIWVSGAEFNVITMLGFVLLSGIVVNNAILLVDFTLRAVRSGEEFHDAALNAVKVRMRPIFMTSLTTMLGMMPLALGRGVGTELYSGLGVAVVGGMALSTVFTLVLIPLVLVTALEISHRFFGKAI
jgi:hydrophobic/amphiphilic exporter-1 (mainly G- bacteria), HAE1 family